MRSLRPCSDSSATPSFPSRENGSSRCRLPRYMGGGLLPCTRAGAASRGSVGQGPALGGWTCLLISLFPLPWPLPCVGPPSGSRPWQIQSLSCVQLCNPMGCSTPDSLSITNSWSRNWDCLEQGTKYSALCWHILGAPQPGGCRKASPLVSRPLPLHPYPVCPHFSAIVFFQVSEGARAGPW